MAVKVNSQEGWCGDLRLLIGGFCYQPGFSHEGCSKATERISNFVACGICSRLAKVVARVVAGNALSASAIITTARTLPEVGSFKGGVTAGFRDRVHARFGNCFCLVDLIPGSCRH